MAFTKKVGKEKVDALLFDIYTSLKEGVVIDDKFLEEGLSNFPSIRRIGVIMDSWGNGIDILCNTDAEKEWWIELYLGLGSLQECVRTNSQISSAMGYCKGVFPLLANKEYNEDRKNKFFEIMKMKEEEEIGKKLWELLKSEDKEISRERVVAEMEGVKDLLLSKNISWEEIFPHKGGKRVELDHVRKHKVMVDAVLEEVERLCSRGR